MKEHLLFQLYGPLQSWGDIAVGEARPSFAHPTKSAVMGLLAAALGLRREEEEKHAQLQESYGFAVRVDNFGVPLSDYHTAQVPKTQKGKKWPTRKAELEDKKKLNTILSKRAYRCDALFTVCLWNQDSSPPYSLTYLKDKLAHPIFTLYLGRKSCPLSLPLSPRLVSADSLREAFAEWQPARELLPKLIPKPPTKVPVYWESHENSGIETAQQVRRRDATLSRLRWQFANRIENQGVVQTPDIEEEE